MYIHIMDIILFISTFFAIELFESNWQKADTLFGVVANNYKIYKIGIFVFLFMNFSFMYSIFLMYYFNNFSFMMLSIVAMKFFDIAFKLRLIQIIEDGGFEALQQIFSQDIKINLFLRYMNAIIYPAIFYYSIY